MLTAYGSAVRKWANTLPCDSATRKLAVCEMQAVRVSVCHTFTGPDGRVSKRCLYHHSIKNLTVRGLFDCGRACRAYPRCHSFNLRLISEKEMLCQLNDATGLKADDTKAKAGCDYFNSH